MATATGLVLSAAQTVFAALQSTELTQVFSMFGYKTELQELQKTITIIKAVLLDVESKQQQLTNEGQNWVENLKDAVYDIDDLLDDFRTTALQRQQMKHAKFSKKVRRFFSHYNKFLVAFNASQDIKTIRNKLTSISKNRSDFGFGDTYEPVMKREETYSYVHEDSIIGREKEKQDIVSILLHGSDTWVCNQEQEHVSFVTIVGMGGLGKTALAQLVFTDGRVKNAFELTLWVCVSEGFSIKQIISKMIRRDEHTMEGLLQEARKEIEGKRYLLVLDDVWEEDRKNWLMLRDILLLGGKGSRVLVTSRSKMVARILENNVMYELGVLSDANSWFLFKKMAFEYGQEPADTELVEIGKDIVKTCAYVPLSIKVIGSLLFGQEKSKWLYFRSVDLSKLRQGKDDIMSILMFSYYHLTPSLKTCFSYCALFPKDYVIQKQELINLWLALGCLDDGLEDGRCLEDVGEESFSILLQRCLLQDANKDSIGRIFSCKMHDLIHDLAQQVAGKEVVSLAKMTCSKMSSMNISMVDRKIRHLYFCDDDFDSLSKMKELRTFVRPDEFPGFFEAGVVPTILTNYPRLRILNLQRINFKFGNKALSHLTHLRYLNLSYNVELEMLPKPITKLLNLQVLCLEGCRKLKELPKDLNKLINLRHLNITGCNSLTHMPVGMGSLVNLHTLPVFVLGERSSPKVQIGQLRDLKPLTKLGGEICIIVKGHNCCDDGGVYLVNKSHLKILKIDSKVPFDERFLESLKPHRDVRRIEISLNQEFRFLLDKRNEFPGYDGIKLPPWAATMTSTLPYLVHVSLSYFPRLQHLPSLSRLQHLKILKLKQMHDLEYMEDDEGVASVATKQSTFFQSLEELYLCGFPKLKGWWREHDLTCLKIGKEEDCCIIGSVDRRKLVMPSFPRLHTLEMHYCPTLISFPSCPHVKKVTLFRFNEALRFCSLNEAYSASLISSSRSSIISTGGSILVSTADIASNSTENHNLASGDVVFDLQDVNIDNVNALNSLFGGSLKVTTLRIEYSGVKCLSAAFGGMKNLSNLQRLNIMWCHTLELDVDELMPWKALHNLSLLRLQELPKVVNLPKGFQYLTSLQSLEIQFCNNLVGLPEWIGCLRSLGSLSIWGCPKVRSLPERLPSIKLFHIGWCDGSLKERLQEPDGEDWPKIRHIPHRMIC